MPCLPRTRNFPIRDNVVNWVFFFPRDAFWMACFFGYARRQQLASTVRGRCRTWSLLVRVYFSIVSFIVLLPSSTASSRRHHPWQLLVASDGWPGFASTCIRSFYLIADLVYYYHWKRNLCSFNLVIITPSTNVEKRMSMLKNTLKIPP